MQTRQLGDTGISVSALGFGAMQIGDPRIPEKQAEQLLNGVLDLGITLIDTARSYGSSEQRIGRYLAHRRDEFILSTKVGYGVEGCRDWTYDCVRRGVDEARDRLRTDLIDIVHLHSCPHQTLADTGVVDALDEARSTGSVRATAYSGDGADLEWAVRSDRFDSVQLSYNICDRSNLAGTFAEPAVTPPGVLAKRVLAGAPWSTAVPSDDTPEAQYRRRFELLRDHITAPQDGADLALRFCAFADGVDSALSGSLNLRHLESNVASLGRGPLSLEQMAQLGRAYNAVGSQWTSIV